MAHPHGTKFEATETDCSCSCRYFLISLGLILAFVLLGAGNAVPQSTPQAKEPDNKADQNLKSVARINPSTLAMEMSVPLLGYPGRNGNGLPIGFNYSSKVWRMDNWATYWYLTPVGGYRQYVTHLRPLYAERSAAGWTSTISFPIIEEKLEIYDQDGKLFSFEFDEFGLNQAWQNYLDWLNTPSNLESCPISEWCGICTGDSSPFCERDPNGGGGGGGGGGELPRRMHYVKRVNIRMGDGATHEFRKSDAVFGYCTGGPSQNEGPNCEGIGRDKLGTFLSVDGSGMRLERTAQGSTLFLQNGDRYLFPAVPTSTSNEGTLYYAAESIDSEGNRSLRTTSGVSGQNAMLTDTLGRQFSDPLPQNLWMQTQQEGTQQVQLPGLNNGTQEYQLKWLRLKPVGCETSTDPDCGDGIGALEHQDERLHFYTGTYCNGNAYTSLLTDSENPDNPANEVLFPWNGWGLRSCNPTQTARMNHVVLGEIILPSGKKYEFKYNQFGEITKVSYPTGSYETFVYATIVPMSGFNDSAYDQTNRGVIEHRVYNSNGTLEQRWQYTAQLISGAYKVTKIVSNQNDPMSDGMKTERFVHSDTGNEREFGFDSSVAGMPKEEKSYDELGQLRTRNLTEWVVAPPRIGGDSRATRDPRVKRTVSVTIENGQALATLSETEYDENGSADPEHFSHLNAKRSKSHHFRNIPLSLAQTGTIEQIAGYFNSSTVATISETDYAYDASYKARGIPSLPIETRSLDPADNSVLAKTQTIYDNQFPAAAANYPSGYSIQNYGIAVSFDCSDDPQEQKICWEDPSSAYLGRPTTSRRWDSDNNIWIETHTRYDIFGNAIAAQDPIGNESTTLYEDAPGKPYKYAYPTRVDTPAPDPTNTGHGSTQGSFSTSTYDFTTGLPLTVTDEFGQTTATEYNDPLLRPTRSYAVNFTAPETQTIYDDENLTVTVRKQIDATNWDEATTYMDSLGRTIKTRAADSEGDVFVETKYDFLGRPHMTTNPYRQGDTVLWSLTEFDEMGRAIQSREPVENQNPLNPSGNILGVTSYDISSVPGFLGLSVTTTDAAGKKSRSITNALGQLMVVEEPDHQGNLDPLPQSSPEPSPTPGGGGSPAPQPPCLTGQCPIELAPGEYGSYATYYRYDALGKMVEVTQGVQKRWFKYDSLGRLIRVRQPEQEVNTALNLADAYNTSGEWTAGFTYDVMGNVLTATDANGVTITNTYDNTGRVKTRTYSGEPQGQTTPPVSFYYDGKGLSAPQSPNFAKGKLTRVISSVSETQYQLFDNLGRLTQSAQITDGQTYTSKYTYNLSGALIEEEYPSGRIVKNEFEPDGDLLKVSSKRAGSGVYAPYASNFSYTASGGISQMRLGNGRWETAKFNTRLQVTELGLGNSATDASVWKTVYEYGELDANGNVDTAKNTGNIARQTLTVPGTSFVQSYKYDSLYRLTEAVEKTGTETNWSQAFNYDRYGNRIAIEQAIGAITLDTTPAVDENTNRFNSGQDFSYDKNGNVVGDRDEATSLLRQFVFNGDNKQAEVKRDGVPIGRYYYDGEGKRIKKVTDTETTVFVYSAGKLIAEYSTVVAAPEQAKTAYTTTDHLGTPRIITDQLGQVRARRDFMPFGEELYTGIGARSASLNYGTSEDDIRQKFTGYQKDNETGLDFAEARMYENRFGRFTAVDPLLASGKSTIPQTFNRYVYAGNNPVLIIDPNGTDWYISFKYHWVNGKVRLKSISPYWKDCRNCGRKWGTKGTVVDNGVTRSYNASWAFYDSSINKYIAVDKYENRPQFEFGTSAEAINQVTAWDRQAAINFAAGFASGASFAISLSGADGLVAETGTQMYAMGQRAGIGASIASAITGIGLANALVSRFGNAGLSIFKSIRVTEGALSEFAHAGKFGFGSYDNLRSGVLSTFGTGSGLQVHHLIEKRFASVIGGKAGDMTSIVLTKPEHDAFTAAWRQLIPYGTNATREQIENAAREVYKNHPDILKALGLN